MQFEGEMENGERHGWGRLIIQREGGATELVGVWQRDQLFGQGSATFADGTKYTGTWSYGLRSGHGLLEWASGDRFEGDWRDDRMHG